MLILRHQDFVTNIFIVYQMTLQNCNAIAETFRIFAEIIEDLFVSRKNCANEQYGVELIRSLGNWTTIGIEHLLREECRLFV